MTAVSKNTELLTAPENAVLEERCYSDSPIGLTHVTLESLDRL